MTNTHVALEKLLEAREENKTNVNEMSEKEIQDYIWWPLDKLQSHLLETVSRQISFLKLIIINREGLLIKIGWIII